MPIDLIHPRDLNPLDGSEPIGRRTVLDFWRWALGDLRMNTARGYLVEYLVATAIGDESPIRIEWGPYDAKGADGTLIEIKTSGLLQSWATKRPSTPTWSFKSVRASRVWSNEIGDWEDVNPKSRVHVWVFALQTCRDTEAYDPLSIDQWEFRLMPHRQLLASGQTSAGLSFFERHGINPVSYEALPNAVREARLANDALALVAE